MNKFKGRITHIESTEQMSIVDLNVGGDIFTAIVIETPRSADYLKVGSEAYILFKETEVCLAKNLSGLISIRNRARSTISSIERGKLLAKVVLVHQDKRIVSIITTRSADKLDLKTGDEVEWLVKTSEVSIMPEQV